jgi:uncharacterized membrane protein YedE/YeeE
MSFTPPMTSLAGGVLIGLAAAALLLGAGRIAGISGIVGDVLHGHHGARAWRLYFLAGLVGGGTLIAVLWPDAFERTALAPGPLLAAAGLLVGFGTRLGSGCTSGHGVCGIGRLSPRSLAATGVFMLTGAATVFVLRHVLGLAGAS